MRIFLIETERSHFANELFSAWLKSELPDCELVRVDDGTENVMEILPIAITEGIDMAIHLGEPTLGAAIQMGILSAMGVRVHAFGLPMEGLDPTLYQIVDCWSWGYGDFDDIREALTPAT